MNNSSVSSSFDSNADADDGAFESAHHAPIAVAAAARPGAASASASTNARPVRSAKQRDVELPGQAAIIADLTAADWKTRADALDALAAACAAKPSPSQASRGSG
jgi:hypothetical protein